MILIFLAIMAIIFVIELSINDDNKELDIVSTTNKNEVTSKEIKVLSLSIKDEDVTIICDSNYKILIHKNKVITSTTVRFARVVKSWMVLKSMAFTSY